MRTIQLLKNKSGDWFVNTTGSGNIISTQESYSSPAKARAAFIEAGRHMPYAKMVVDIGNLKPVVVRKGQPTPPRDEAITSAAAFTRDLMRVRRVLKS